METIGERIHRLRKEKNMTQEELAKKVGYTSRTTINKIEKNIIDLPRSKITLLARAFEVSEEYLLGLKTNVNLYQRILCLLNDQNITMEQLSQSISVDCEVLKKRFSNKTLIDDLDFVNRIAKFFKVDFEYLLFGRIYVDDIPVGTKIKLFRIENNITKSELAKLAGYSIEQLENIEKNNIKLTIDEETKFSELLCKEDSLNFFIDEDLRYVDMPTSRSYVTIAVENECLERYYLNKEQATMIRELVLQLNKVYLKEKKDKE